MSASLVASVVLACTFGGALLGMLLRRFLPDAQLGADAKDTIKVTMGMVASMTALVLGLVTASAKSSYDSADAGAKKAAVDLLTLDRVLARYGPETREIRVSLKQSIEARADEIWPANHRVNLPARGFDKSDFTVSERLADEIRVLRPGSDSQRQLRARALELTERLLEERWLTVSQASAPVPNAFLVILVFWLVATFGSYGLFAPSNVIVFSVLIVGSMSVSAAFYLILELGGPFDGEVKISAEPMRRAIELMAN